MASRSLFTESAPQSGQVENSGGGNMGARYGGREGGEGGKKLKGNERPYTDFHRVMHI